MAKPHRAARDLEVAEDFAFQRRSWRAQRAGWVLIALIVAAAAAGLMGDGPLSEASVTSGAGVVRFERIARAHAPLEWRVRGAAAANGTLRVAIDSALLRDLKVESIVPVPMRLDSGPDRLAYVFHAPPGTQVDVTLRLRAVAAGRLEGGVALNDGAPASLGILILP